MAPRSWRTLVRGPPPALVDALAITSAAVLPRSESRLVRWRLLRILEAMIARLLARPARSRHRCRLGAEDAAEHDRGEPETHTALERRAHLAVTLSHLAIRLQSAR